MFGAKPRLPFEPLIAALASLRLFFAPFNIKSTHSSELLLGFDNFLSITYPCPMLKISAQTVCTLGFYVLCNKKFTLKFDFSAVICFH